MSSSGIPPFNLNPYGASASGGDGSAGELSLSEKAKIDVLIPTAGSPPNAAFISAQTGIDQPLVSAYLQERKSLGQPGNSSGRPYAASYQADQRSHSAYSAYDEQILLAAQSIMSDDGPAYAQGHPGGQQQPSAFQSHYAAPPAAPGPQSSAYESESTNTDRNKIPRGRFIAERTSSSGMIREDEPSQLSRIDETLEREQYYRSYQNSQNLGTFGKLPTVSKYGSGKAGSALSAGRRAAEPRNSPAATGNDLDPATISTKQRIAGEVMTDLKKAGVSLTAKKVLDVGFGLGFNSKAMQSRGADVYGVEPDPKAYSAALAHSNLQAGNAIHGKLQDLPPDMKGTFDVATVFLWNMSFAERDQVLRDLGKSIKPGGTVVIGLADESYSNDPSAAVPPLFQKHFSKVYMTPINDKHVNRTLVIAKDPRQ